MIKRLKLLSTQIKLKVNSGFFLRQQCVACLTAICDRGLCDECLQSLPANHQHCRQCALPLTIMSDQPLLCGGCLQHPPPFSRVIAPWRYEYPVDRLISRYKYSQQRALGQPLINSLVDTVTTSLAQQPTRRPDLLIPSPMHPQKQRQRTFNQAEEIAEQLSRALDIPWSVTLVRRTQSGVAQSGLNRQQRLSNLRDIFTVTDKPPPRVAIVDDVITTGATARALATILNRAGAAHIEIWALARTPDPGVSRAARPRNQR